MRLRQQEIITDLKVQSTINPLEEIERRSQFLADYLGHASLNGFVLGISGGQDSLLAGILAQRAVELRRNNGHDATFHAMLLPYGEQIDNADVKLAIETINPDVIHYHNIKPSVDATAQEFTVNEGHALSDYNKGNVKARTRMTAQYLYSGENNNPLVIGTDHAAEAVTGFFTKYGDGGADILPLSGLTKRQGRAMLTALGVPELFITKPPTADLLDNKPNQADEAELGLSYDAIDDYLEGKEVPDEVANSIERRYLATEHKRALPVSPLRPQKYVVE